MSKRSRRIDNAAQPLAALPDLRFVSLGRIYFSNYSEGHTKVRLEGALGLWEPPQKETNFKHHHSTSKSPQQQQPCFSRHAATHPAITKLTMNTQQAKRTATSQYVKDSAGCQSPGQLGALKRLGISGKCSGSTEAMESVSNSSLRRRWLEAVVFKSVAPCQAMRLGAKPSSRISKAKAKELTNLDMPKGELNPLQAETETETVLEISSMALEKPCEKNDHIVNLQS